jgi:hypothetical protein
MITVALHMEMTCRQIVLDLFVVGLCGKKKRKKEEDAHNTRLILFPQFQRIKELVNPFTASCENAMTLSVPRIPASCEKFPHSSQLNF